MSLFDSSSLPLPRPILLFYNGDYDAFVASALFLLAECFAYRSIMSCVANKHVETLNALAKMAEISIVCPNGLRSTLTQHTFIAMQCVNILYNAHRWNLHSARPQALNLWVVTTVCKQHFQQLRQFNRSLVRFHVNTALKCIILAQK